MQFLKNNKITKFTILLFTKDQILPQANLSVRLNMKYPQVLSVFNEEILTPSFFIIMINAFTIYA